MKYIDSLGIYISKVEDLRDKVTPDLYESIEYLIQEDNEVEELKDNYKALQEEFTSYEFTCEEMRNLLIDTLDAIKTIGSQLDDMYDYVVDSKRINRDALGKKILDIKLGKIAKNINNVL